MAHISFNIAFNKLKIAQIVYVNQFFQFLNLVHIYGHGFFELSRMLMRKNVNNDVSKDSPINFWVKNRRSKKDIKQSLLGLKSSQNGKKNKKTLKVSFKAIFNAHFADLVSKEYFSYNVL